MSEGTRGKGPAAVLPRFRDLAPRQRVKVALCVAFATFHIAMSLFRGAWPGLRDPLQPYIGWYTDSLRMASTWGMFSRPPDPTDVVVMGVFADGSRVELSHTDPQRRGWFGRIVDVRLRKIQNRLQGEADREAWGKPYLEYFCRATPAEKRLRRVELELVEHPADATTESEENPATRERVMTVSCRRKGRRR